MTWKRKSALPLSQPGDSERWKATIDWIEREKIAAVRPTKSQLKVGPLNFYPDRGTIQQDGMPASGLFIDPTAPGLRKRPIQQLMREHVLLQAAIMRGDYAEGRFVVILPALNYPMQSACRRYAAHLAEPAAGKAGFGTVALEAFIDALHSAGETDHAAGLFGRYVDWSLIDEEIEANFPAALAG